MGNKNSLLKRNNPKPKAQDTNQKQDPTSASTKPNPYPISYKVSNYSNYGAKTNSPLSILKALAVCSTHQLVYTSGYDTPHIAVLRTNTPAFVEYLEGHTDCVFSLAVDEDKKLLVSGGRDQRLIFWRIGPSAAKPGNHVVLKTCSDLGSFVTTVRIARTGDFALALQNDGKIFKYSTKSFELIGTFEKFGYSFAQNYFDVSNDSATIFGVIRYQTKVFRSVKTKPSQRSFFKEFPDCIISFKSHGAVDYLFFADEKGSLFGLNLRTYKLFFRVKLEPKGSSKGLSIEVTRGNLLYVGSAINMVYIFRLEHTGRLTRLQKLKTGLASVIANYISRDGKTIAFGGGNTLEVYKTCQDRGITTLV